MPVEIVGCEVYEAGSPLALDNGEFTLLIEVVCYVIVDKNLVLVQNRIVLFCSLIPRGVSGWKFLWNGNFQSCFVSDPARGQWMEMLFLS